MVESLGWFYSLPMIGKTIFTSFYANASAWFKRTFLHPVATTLTVDKLSRDEVEEMLAAEQRAIARRALQEKFGDRQLNLSLERLEFLRRRALEEQTSDNPRRRHAPTRFPPTKKPPSSKTCEVPMASINTRPLHAPSASHGRVLPPANRPLW